MRRYLPAFMWLSVAVVSFGAAWRTWPEAPHVPTPRAAANPLPAPSGTPEPALAAAEEPATTPVPAPATLEAPAPLPETEPLARAEPKAGRQVLRCSDQGRTAYKDLHTACADGPGERVIVYPTQGVERPR